MKKMNNKGFSLVELIIVIAIMAILAGALAPALISYVAKSRRSTTVSNAQTIASGIQSAISDEAVLDDLETNTKYKTIDSAPIKFDSSGLDTSGAFYETVNSNVSGGIDSYATLKATKFSKKATGTGLNGQKIDSTSGYYISIDPASSTIKIYVKSQAKPTTAATAADGKTAPTDALVELYPNANDAMTK